MKQGTLLRRKDEPRRIVLFTLAEGACPTYSIHLHCHGVCVCFELFFDIVNDFVLTPLQGVIQTIITNTP
jgi:hypothetical protein